MNLTLSSLYEPQEAVWIPPSSSSSSSGSSSSASGLRDFDQQYELLHTIGRGQTSEVKVARRRSDGSLFACKLIDKSAISVKRMREEIRVLLAVRHANIVSLHEVFETEEDVRLICELVEGGELFNRITLKKHYSEREACEVLASLLSAVAFLHDRNIIHRDIKPENILLASQDSDVEIKLSDFGYAKMFEEEDGGASSAAPAMEEVHEEEEVVYSFATHSPKNGSSSNLRSRQQRAFTTVGTDFYIAPEILREGGYGKAVDMWSVGVVAYILLCGFPPFPDVSKIRDGVFTFPAPFWDGVSFLAQDFVKRLLTVDADARMTARGALAHPWISTRHHTEHYVAQQQHLQVPSSPLAGALSPHHSHMFRKFNKKRRGFHPSPPSSSLSLDGNKLG